MNDKPEKIRVCFLEEWAPIDNDKVKKGMYEVSNAGRIRYSKDQARSVCEMLSSGKYDNAGDLLESIGMEDNERNRKFVSRIKRRQSFADISKDYEF